jgi:ElaB/YqjD/DUF883 family membrane-anchored ribosome-binding protein
MYKDTLRRRHHREFDLYGDVAKIKAALAEATQDVKNKTGEIFTDSIENIKDKTLEIQDDVANYTAERPFKSIGLALVTGALLGYLIRKRK